MIDAFFSGLVALADPGRVGALLLGLVLGFVAGIAPGIGGRIGLLLALPLAILFDPLTGGVFLISLHAVVHTSGSITPIAYGLPTSASEAATAIDGFQLQKQGKGAEALGASLSASAIGGVIGALAFILAVPVARPIVASIGAPEFLVLALLGLAFVSTLSDRRPSAGLGVAALGVLASTVGMDPLTAQPRYTFGRLEFWDGLETISVIGGLFVIPEMLALARNTGWVRSTSSKAEFRRMVSGMGMTFRHNVILLRSTVIGILVGIMPGAGSSVAVWISYADAARHDPGGVPFGSGAIAGVVAPEAANNSKEGGALIPTVFFGIPGSSSMAILLGGFTMLGIDAGPSFLTSQLSTAMTFGWTVILANILTVPLFLLVVPWLLRLTAPKPSVIAPFALLAIVTVALGVSDNSFGLLQFAAGGAFGVALYLAGLPRAPFLLGFIMGPLIETSLAKSVQIFGAGALLRPGVILLGLTLVVVLLRLQRPQISQERVQNGSSTVAAFTFAGMLASGAAAIAGAIGFVGTSWIAPVFASGVVMVACLVAWMRLGVHAKSNGAPAISRRMTAVFCLLLALLPLVGLIPASAAFLAWSRKYFSKRTLSLLLGMSIVAALQFLLIEGLMGRSLSFGLVGEAMLRRW